MPMLRHCPAVLVLCLLALPVGAATLWQLGRADDSAGEFADYAKAATTLNLPADAKSPAIPKGLRGDANPALEISFDLAAPPANGVFFSFKLLHAPRCGAQCAVFSNRLFAGLIQLWGTQGTSSPYHWKKTYRLYIPREMLRAGRNTLRLETARPLWSNASGDGQIWWEWDYLRLESLDARACEPIHGAVTYLGTTLKHSANDFYVNDDTLQYAPVALKWLGIAYSGNTIRADFWQNVGQMQPRRKQYLKLLADYNMTAIADFISPHPYHMRLGEDGQLEQKTKDQLDAFFHECGPLFQWYELGNEPCMFGGGFREALVLARYLDQIKPPHVKLTACGWAYGGGQGEPPNWDADVNLRRKVELLCQATNGHSYGFSYADNRGGSFIENLKTFGGVEDGWPVEFVNTETGANNWHSEENGPRLPSSQPHAQAFDRILRAHLAVVDRTIQHAACFDDFGLFDKIDFKNLAALRAYPGVKNEDTRLKTFRRLALAYATHGAPLPYVVLNAEAVAGKKVYFRPLDTSKLPPQPGSNAVSDKVLLNFVNFEPTPQRIRVRVTLPERGDWPAERFITAETFAASRSSLILSASPDVELTAELGPGDSIQYILTPPVRRPRTPAGSSTQFAGSAQPWWSALPKAPPAAPAHLSAIAGDGRILLQWSAPENAVTYTIQRSDKPGAAPLTVTTEAAGTRFMDDRVSNGVAYAYSVSAAAFGPSGPACAAVSATPLAGPLPESWNHQDIGRVGKKGSASFIQQTGIFTLTATGDDIWAKADGLHFAYQPIRGDATLTAQVLCMDNTSENARAGVCIRASAAPNAAMAILALTPGKGCGFTHRDRDDADCAFTGGAAHPWLRITRSGDTIRGEVSQDGLTWKAFGSARIELPPQALLGLAVSSHHNGMLNQAMFAGVTLQQEHGR